MKSIYSERETVYKKEQWICPLCRGCYESEQEAVDCWNSHHTEMEIDGYHFDPKQPNPYEIYLKTPDGVHMYRRYG